MIQLAVRIWLHLPADGTARLLPGDASCKVIGRSGVSDGELKSCAGCDQQRSHLHLCVSPCWMSFHSTQNLELSSKVTKQLCRGALICPPITTQLSINRSAQSQCVRVCECVCYPLYLAQVIEPI